MILGGCFSRGAARDGVRDTARAAARVAAPHRRDIWQQASPSAPRQVVGKQRSYHPLLLSRHRHAPIADCQYPRTPTTEAHVYFPWVMYTTYTLYTAYISYTAHTSYAPYILVYSVYFAYCPRHVTARHQKRSCANRIGKWQSCPTGKKKTQRCRSRASTQGRHLV